MRAVLLRQEFNDEIPAGLPPGTRVAHKTGQITGHLHDAAIVYPQRTAGRTCSSCSRAAFDDEKVARSLIADISRLVYEHAMRGARRQREERPMKIAVGADHAGFPLKERMIEAIREAGHEVIDCGAGRDHSRRRLSRFACRARRDGDSRWPGRSRCAHLRQRRRRLGRSEQVRRHSRRALPRHVLRPIRASRTTR